MKKHLSVLIAAGLACLAPELTAQIVVGPGGFVLTFTNQPTLASGWSTVSVMPNAGTAITNDTQLDTAVATNGATQVTNALTTSGTYPPATAGLAQWNNNAGSGFFIQLRPTGNSYTLLMATLTNTTGSNISVLDIAYDFNALVASGSTINESIYGLRAYWSLTGATGTWASIPELCTGTAGSLGASISVGSWPSGTLMYLLWADDNGPSSDAAPQREGGYTIDNFIATPHGGTLAVAVNPGTSTINECDALTFRATVTGGTPPYSYQWYHANSPINTATNSTYPIASAQVSDGGSYFVVVRDNVSATVSNAPSTLTVQADTGAPVMLFAYLSTDRTNITVAFSKKVNIAHTNGSDFVLHPLDNSGDISFLKAALNNLTNVVLTAPNPLPQQNFEVRVQGDGVTSCRFTVANGTATRLAQQLLLLGINTNSLWRYNQEGVELPSEWKNKDYNDVIAGWNSGYAVLDNKRDAAGRTNVNGQLVRTFLSVTNALFPSTTGVIPTFYFRSGFYLPANPADVTLRFRNFFDDYAIIYVNGQEAYRDTNIVATNEAFATYIELGGTIGTANWSTTRTLPGTNAVAGTNVVAVYLKQGTDDSTDITMGLEITALVTNFSPVVPDARLTLVDNHNRTITIAWTPPTGTLLESSTLRTGSWTNSSSQANGTPRSAPVSPKFYKVLVQ